MSIFFRYPVSFWVLDPPNLSVYVCVCAYTANCPFLPFVTIMSSYLLLFSPSPPKRDFWLSSSSSFCCKPEVRWQQTEKVKEEGKDRSKRDQPRRAFSCHFFGRLLLLFLLLTIQGHVYMHRDKQTKHWYGRKRGDFLSSCSLLASFFANVVLVRRDLWLVANQARHSDVIRTNV